MKIITLKGGYDSNFTYILHNEKECCVLDPAVSSKEIFSRVEKEGLIVRFVVILHSHFDHIVELESFRKKGIAIYGHESAKIDVQKRLREGDVIGFEGVKLTVLHTPGHRYDAICLLAGKKLFTSDTLFVQGYGRVDFPGSDQKLMKKSLQRLLSLSDDIVIYPGHDYGDTPTGTIGEIKGEIKRNFL